MDEIWVVYGQLDLEVVYNLSKINIIPFNFCEFWSEKTPQWKYTQKKNLWCSKHYNLMDPMEWRAVTFWGWCPIR
jgi:hypothetical protein